MIILAGLFDFAFHFLSFSVSGILHSRDLIMSCIRSFMVIFSSKISDDRLLA
jgi:hypothetical protein